MTATILLIVALLFPPTEHATALCIIHHESGGNPTLINDHEPHHGGSVGLFQIAADNLAYWRLAGLEDWPHMTLRQARTLLQDPFWNIAAAAAIWREHGWDPHWRAQKGRCF